MSRPDTDCSYFESMYAGSTDPWGFDSRFYEQRKYDLTVASLPKERYRSAFEPGCANGALTERLAPRCDRLLACDIVGEAVRRARERLATAEHVTVTQERFPTFWPRQQLDLVVWSEVAYYLGDSSLDAALRAVEDRLDPLGDLVVVNYTGPTDYPQTADSVDKRIERSGLLDRHTACRSVDFRLDVWRRRSSTDGG